MVILCYKKGALQGRGGRRKEEPLPSEISILSDAVASVTIVEKLHENLTTKPQNNNTNMLHYRTEKELKVIQPSPLLKSKSYR